jgi:hypothetical protein
MIICVILYGIKSVQYINILGWHQEFSIYLLPNMQALFQYCIYVFHLRRRPSNKGTYFFLAIPN